MSTKAAATTTTTATPTMSATTTAVPAVPLAVAVNNTNNNLVVSPNEKEDYGVAGCFHWRHLNELKGLPEIIAHFHAACQAESFAGHCQAVGFANASFHPNSITTTTTTTNNSTSTSTSKEGNLKAGQPGYDKFSAGLAAESKALAATNVCLGVVFHGTAAANIPNILTHGLDKKRRCGQAYGPGEYFSKEPTLSIGYSKGGLEMVVFVVVLPPTLNNTLTKAQPDYVVVENNQYHLAIGVLKFDSVDNAVLRISQGRRSQFLALSLEVVAKTRIKTEAETKAKIIQYLIAAEIDFAAELYQKKSSFLGHLTKREISFYVHQNLDEDVHDWYFPGLPPAYIKLEDMETSQVQNLDDATSDERTAKQNLEDARKTMYSGSVGGVGGVGTNGAASAVVPASASASAQGNIPSFGLANPMAPNVNMAPLAPLAPIAAPIFGVVNSARPAAFGVGGTATAGSSFTFGSSSTSTSTSTPVADGKKTESRDDTVTLSLSSAAASDPSTQICKHLISNRIDMASELYHKKHGGIDVTAKKEIFAIASRCVDDPSLLPFLFPGLPQPTPTTTDSISNSSSAKDGPVGATFAPGMN